MLILKRWGREKLDVDQGSGIYQNVKCHLKQFWWMDGEICAILHQDLNGQIRKDSCYMTVLAGNSSKTARARGSFEQPFMRTFALACVLFALTLRAALPLGLSVVTDDRGIPMVICSQVAQIQLRLDGEGDSRQTPSAPGYQCPFCMVLNADNAGIPVLDAPKPPLGPVAVAQILRPASLWIDSSAPRKDDNLGRDPPLA